MKTDNKKDTIDIHSIYDVHVDDIHDTIKVLDSNGVGQITMFKEGETWTVSYTRKQTHETSDDGPIVA